MVYYIRHLYHSPFSEISVLDGKKEGTFLSYIFYQLVNYYGFQSFRKVTKFVKIQFTFSKAIK